MKKKLRAECRLIRSKRKTLGICVYPSGEVIIRAPERMPENEIWRLVENKAEWIGRKLEELKKLEENGEKDGRQHQYNSGERFLYLGEWFALERRGGSKKRPEIFLTESCLVLVCQEKEPEQVQRLLESWYREEARQYIQKRTVYYAEKIGEYPESIRIKEQKSRWGSCSSKRNLNFNWRLIMAPPEIIDYVIVHELCHLKHMNHSREFWRCVEKILPDYSKRRQWLSKNGISLRL